MKITEIKSKLMINEGNLQMKVGEIAVNDLNILLKRFPEEKLEIKNVIVELKEDLFPKQLTVYGDFAGGWKITGIDPLAYSFSKTKLLITEDDKGNNTIDLSVEGKIKIGSVELPTVTKFKDDKLLKCLPELDGNTFRLIDVYKFETGSKDDSVIPANIDALNNLTVNQFVLEFSIKDKKKSHISIELKSLLKWKILSEPVELILEDVTTGYDIIHSEVKKNIKSFQFSGFVGGTIGLKAGTSSEKYKVKISVIPKSDWILRIDASEQKGFPQIEALCSIAGGKELAKTVTDLFTKINLQALQISRIEIAFDVFKPRISYLNLSGKIAIGGIEINSTLLLPNLSLSGSLVSYGESKEPIVKISAAAFLKNMKLPVHDLPELSINWVQFFVDPSAGSYFVHLDLAGNWAFDNKIKLEDLDIKLVYANNTVSGEVTGTLKLFNKFEVIASAKSSTKDGWTFEGKTKPGQEIGLDVLAKDVLDTFHVTLPFNLPEIKIKDVKVEFNTAKRDFLLSVTMTEFSLEKLNITGIKLIDGIKVENAVFRLEIKNGKTPEGLLKGEVVIDGTRFCVTFEKSSEGVSFTGAIKELSIDLDKIGGNLIPGLKDLVKPISKVEFSKIEVKYLSKEKQFALEIDIRQKLVYDFKAGELSKIELSDVRFLFTAGSTEVKGSLLCSLAIGEKAKFVLGVSLSSGGFRLEGKLAGGLSIDLTEIVAYLLGKDAVNIFKGVPKEYQEIKFNKLSLAIDTGSRSASFEAGIEGLGGAKFALLESNEKKFGFVFGIIPSDSLKFSKVHESLKVFDGIDLSGTCLIISSVEQPKLPWEDLRKTIKETKIVKGLNLFASMSLKNKAEAGDTAQMANRLGELIKVDNLTIHGAIGVTPTSILIEGYIGSFAIGQSSLKLENAGLRLSVDGIFAVYGTVSLDFKWLTDKIPPMCFTGVLKIQANGIEVSAIWTGDFGTEQLRQLAEACKDITQALPPGSFEKINESVRKQISPNIPDGTLKNLASAEYAVLGTLSELGKAGEKVLNTLPGIQIKEVGLILGCDWEWVPTGGCVGRFTLNGDKPENEGLIAFLFNSNNPAQSMLQIKFPKDAEQTIIKFLDKCAGIISVPEKRPDWTKLLEVNGYEYENKWIPLQVKIVPMDVMIGDITYKQGIIIQGRVVIFSFIDIITNIILDFETGIKAFGQVKPIVIKNNGKEILEISGVDKPLLPANRILKENLDTQSPVYNGPLFDLSIPLSFDLKNLPYMKMCGKVKLLGFEVLKTYCEISADGVYFNFSGQNPVAEYSLKCSLDNYKSFNASGKLLFDSHIQLQRPRYETGYVPIPIIDTFEGDVTLTVTNLKCLFSVEISFKVINPSTGEYIVFKTKITIDVLDTLTKLIESVTGKTKNKLIRVFEIVCKEIQDEIEKTSSLIEQLMEQISNIIQPAIDELEALLKAIDDEIKKILDAMDLIRRTVEQIDMQFQEARRKVSEAGMQIAMTKVNLDMALNDLAHSIAVCILGNTEVIILAIEAKAVSDYNEAEQNRINTYNQRISSSGLEYIRLLAVEGFWAKRAIDLQTPKVLAQAAAAPVKAARVIVDGLHNTLNGLYEWEKQKIREADDYDKRLNERIRERIRYDTLLPEKNSNLSNTRKLLEEKRALLLSTNNTVMELKQKRMRLAENARNNVVPLMKEKFDKIND